MNEFEANDAEAEVAIAVACDGWRRDIPKLAARCRAAVGAALAAGGWRGPAEVSLLLAGAAEMRRLNRQHRDQDAPTNVLAFPAARTANGGAPVLLGDVALGHETVLAEAAAQDKRPADHLAHLIVHGTLHLLGFDHDSEDEARRMEALEAQSLAGLGIADPYRREVAVAGGRGP
ncbi:MAG: rRNA maturation RNase YbeY [Alphaproteobacteria bacterium]